ncbi:MAG: hypothetical protein CMN74_11840, partial [Sphingorhabdus sp.]|nr:hypothetical protein [Sphingorhabdus sp.]
MGAGQRRVGAAWQHHRHRFDTQQTSVDFDPNECHHRRQRWCIPSLLCFFVLVLSVTSTADITCSDADFDHDCLITSNEDIRGDLRTWMRS